MGWFHWFPKCDKESFIPKGTCHFLLLPAKIKRIKDGSNKTNQLFNYKTTKLYPEMFTAWLFVS